MSDDEMERKTAYHNAVVEEVRRQPDYKSVLQIVINRVGHAGAAEMMIQMAELAYELGVPPDECAAGMLAGIVKGTAMFEAFKRLLSEEGDDVKH